MQRTLFYCTTDSSPALKPPSWLGKEPELVDIWLRSVLFCFFCFIMGHVTVEPFITNMPLITTDLPSKMVSNGRFRHLCRIWWACFCFSGFANGRTLISIHEPITNFYWGYKTPESTSSNPVLKKVLALYTYPPPWEFEPR